MTHRSPAARIAVWAFAFAMVLKAAVPMLASASAALQGKDLADVCDVYGVATVSLPGASPQGGHAHHHHHGGDADMSAMPLASRQAPEPMPSHDGRHTGDHCVLTALLALSAPESPNLATPVATTASIEAATTTTDRVVAPDALARWASRLRHGPPPLRS